MLHRTLGLCLLFAGALCGADRLTLTGTVTDGAGKPLERAKDKSGAIQILNRSTCGLGLQDRCQIPGNRFVQPFSPANSRSLRTRQTTPALPWEAALEERAKAQPRRIGSESNGRYFETRSSIGLPDSSAADILKYGNTVIPIDIQQRRPSQLARR
jgi:hypothetical protein